MTTRLAAFIAATLILASNNLNSAVLADALQSPPDSTNAPSQADERIAGLLDRAEQRVALRQLASATDAFVDALGLLPTASPSGKQALLGFPNRLRLRAQEAAARGESDLASNLRAFADMVLEAATLANTASTSQAAIAPHGDGTAPTVQTPDPIPPALNSPPRAAAAEPPASVALAAPSPAPGLGSPEPGFPLSDKPQAPATAIPAAASEPIVSLPRPARAPSPSPPGNASAPALQMLNAIRRFIPRPQECSVASMSGGAIAASTIKGSPTNAEFYLSRGDQMLGLNQAAEARRLYECAAADGSGRAATAVGETYDPAFLATLRASDVTPDAAAAESWYQKGMALGDHEAAVRLQELEFWRRRAGP